MELLKTQIVFSSWMVGNLIDKLKNGWAVVVLTQFPFNDNGMVGSGSALLVSEYPSN